MIFKLQHMVAAVIATAVVTTLIVGSVTNRDSFGSIGRAYVHAHFPQKYHHMSAPVNANNLISQGAVLAGAKTDLPPCPNYIYEYCVFSCTTHSCLDECTEKYDCMI